MRTTTVNLETFQGAGSPSLYARIGANAFFAGVTIVTFFASTVTGDPFAHFDSQPKWMFMSFCSFAVGMFNVTIGGVVTARFYRLANSDAEPGHEYNRYTQLKTTFTLGTMAGVVLAVATAFLASLWQGAASEVGGFMAPCLFGVFAVIVDVIGIATDAQRLSQERLAFKRATTSDAELGEGEIVI